MGTINDEVIGLLSDSGSISNSGKFEMENEN